jgi:hypothetical protein
LTERFSAMNLGQLLMNSVEVPLPILLAFLLVLAVLIGRKKRGKERKEKSHEDRSLKLQSPQPEELKVATPTHRAALAYRFEEEFTKRRSSELTRRGHLWSRHASWHLPTAPRVDKRRNIYDGPGIEHVRIILKKYDVDIMNGFLPSEDPLQRLPYARYHIWEDLADDLPKLLGARLGQARGPLKELPVLSADKLLTDADLRRAHLLLSLFAHAYVWGGNSPNDIIPEGISKPLFEVSERLGLPPLLGHTSIVLYNWRRLDANADICMENLATLNNFFDGRDESWFYLITVEVEAKGAGAVVPILLANDAIQRYNEEQMVSSTNNNNNRSINNGSGGNMSSDSRKYNISRSKLPSRESEEEGDEDEQSIIYINQALTGELSLLRVSVFVTAQLKLVADAIYNMYESISAMREGCHPFIFYHRVRPFLSGWKHNPTLPDGVIYEGVSKERFQFNGGSSSQSPLLPFLDMALGVEHESQRTKDFFGAMREYMLKPHREFLKYVEKIIAIRSFIESCQKELNERKPRVKSISKIKDDGNEDPNYRSYKILQDLIDCYDNCVSNLQKFRTEHISLVAEYIMAQQKKDVNGLSNSAGGKGTGGTELMNFLKPIRDDCTAK